MDFLEVIQIDRIVKLDELVVSWVWSHNIQIRDVINMVVNHLSVVLGKEVLIKLCLIGHNHLIGSLDQKLATTRVLIRRKTQMDHLDCSRRMCSLSAPVFVQMHVSPASKRSKFRHILFNPKDLLMWSGPQSELEGCGPAIQTVIAC